MWCSIRYKLQRQRRWQKLFGRSSKRYPNYYGPIRRARISSSTCACGTRRAIPDEDFAETFAVWLKPRSDWRKRYAEWPALKKLEYVDELMARDRRGRAAADAARRRRSVEPVTPHAWRALRPQAGASTASIRRPSYDRDLQRIFSDDPRHKAAPAASTFLRRNRGKIRQHGLANGPANISRRWTACWTT